MLYPSTNVPKRQLNKWVSLQWLKSKLRPYPYGLLSYLSYNIFPFISLFILQCMMIIKLKQYFLIYHYIFWLHKDTPLAIRKRSYRSGQDWIRKDPRVPYPGSGNALARAIQIPQRHGGHRTHSHARARDSNLWCAGWTHVYAVTDTWYPSYFSHLPLSLIPDLCDTRAPFTFHTTW
jgi:hypothetical protein